MYFHSRRSAGGSSTIASLLPTKTLAIGGDTRPDQSGVPADFRFELLTKLSLFSALLSQSGIHLIYFHRGAGLSQEP